MDTFSRTFKEVWLACLHQQIRHRELVG